MSTEPQNKPKLPETNVVETPTWCAGCGDYGILMGIKKATIALGRPLHETCVVSGIGCSGKLNHYINTYGFEGIHGRTQPLASGVHLANHDLNVVVVGGDGDGYGIGMGHFMHAMRRNMNYTYIIHDNQIYGLTKGQYSPTTKQGTKTSSTPHGALESAVNPLKLALASDGVSFIARAFSGDIKQLHEIVLAGMQHKGFAVIDVLQQCPTYNKTNTIQFYKSRVYKLEEEEGYDKTDREMAMKRADEWGERIPTGIFYQVDMPTYESSIEALKEKPLVDHDISNVPAEDLFKNFV